MSALYPEVILPSIHCVLVHCFLLPLVSQSLSHLPQVWRIVMEQAFLLVWHLLLPVPTQAGMNISLGQTTNICNLQQGKKCCPEQPSEIF